jgi:cytochrome d ubiquinol oxidase subunit II
MFEELSHLALQQYWWAIIALLGGLLVFLMFVQGGQTLIYTIGKTELERTMLVNTLGRKWEFTFTTLVTFGGAFFASFPLFYSTSFGGAYWVWMTILFAFVIQAVAYEYRSRPNNVFGARTYEAFLLINGLLGTLLIGTAVATFFTGSEFSVNAFNQSRWENPLHGLEAAFNVHNLLLGISVLFLARTLGLLYFINSIEDDALLKRSRGQLAFNAIPFVIAFVSFVVWLFLRDGYAVVPKTGEIVVVPFKYLNNLFEMPVVGILFLGGVLMVIWGIGSSWFSHTRKGIWYAGSGSVLVVFSLFLVAGLNSTSFYPSTSDLQSSLTIQNASSSHFTLTVMSYVSLLVPFVVAYIWYVWKALNVKRIDKEEMASDDIHIY